MKTILRILERAGGYRPSLYLKIENPPYMALVIEATPGLGRSERPPSRSHTMANKMATSCVTRRCVSSYVNRRCAALNLWPTAGAMTTWGLNSIPAISTGQITSSFPLSTNDTRNLLPCGIETSAIRAL